MNRSPLLFNMKKTFLLILLLFITASIDKAQSKNERDELNRLYNLFSVIYKDSLAKAVPPAEKAIPIARLLGNKFIEAKASIVIGKNSIKGHNIPKGKEYLKKALEIGREINNEQIESEASMLLGYALYFMENKTGEGLKLTLRAYELASALNDTIILKDVSTQLVDVYHMHNDPVNAIRYSKIALANNRSDLRNRARIYSLLGVVYNDAGNPEEAIKYIEEGIKIALEIKDDFRTASLYNNMAAIFFSLVKHDAAISYHKKALELFTRMNDPFGIGYSHNLLGASLSSLGKREGAISHFAEAVKIFRKIGNRQSLSFALCNLSNEYLKTGRTKDAFPLVKEAVSISSGNRDNLAMTDAYIAAALYYKKTGNINEAISYLKKGEQTARAINNPGFLINIYEELASYYNISSDSKNAFAYLKLKEETADSLRRKNADKALIEMVVKYEAEMNKKSAEESKDELSRLQSETRGKGAILWIVLGSGFGVIVLLLFIFWKKVSPVLKHFTSISNRPFSDKRNMKSVLKIIDAGSEANLKLRDEITTGISEKLEKLMNEEKAYLQNDLNLKKAAALLDTNTAYLSHIINEQFGLNFSSYLNRHRIEEAKRLLNEHRQNSLTLEGIASSCGFSSRSAFYQAFKKFTGHTPTEYIQIIEKDSGTHQ